MRRLLLAALLLAAAPAIANDAPRFRPLEVWIQSDAPVAAWQVEVVAGGPGTLVGVEGGAAPFDAPPHYDPAALLSGRIVLAAFDTRRALPPGRHRLAVLHVREAGPTTWTVRLQVAADHAGRTHDAQVFVTPATGESR